MQFSALEAVHALATIEAEPTTSLTGTQWAIVITIGVVGILIQKGRGGTANVIGWIMVIGAVIIVIAALVGLGNFINLVGQFFEFAGNGLASFGQLLQNSSS